MKLTGNAWCKRCSVITDRSQWRHNRCPHCGEMREEADDKPRVITAAQALAEASKLANAARKSHYPAGGANIVTAQDVALADAICLLAAVVSALLDGEESEMLRTVEVPPSRWLDSTPP